MNRSAIWLVGLFIVTLLVASPNFADARNSGRLRNRILSQRTQRRSGGGSQAARAPRPQQSLTPVPETRTPQPPTSRQEQSNKPRPVIRSQFRAPESKDEPTPPPVTVSKRVASMQVTQAVNLYKATNGQAPRSQVEFMEKIIKANNISLPKLPNGHSYQYDTEKEQLMDRKPQP